MAFGGSLGDSTKSEIVLEFISVACSDASLVDEFELLFVELRPVALGSTFLVSRLLHLGDLDDP